MARPSRNIDRLLLQAGRELLTETGCRGFSIRQLAERAGVNLGMFHYHFKTRDNFCRAVLADTYEEMFARLTTRAEEGADPMEQLRGALTVLGRFARDHRPLLAQLLVDILSGEALVLEFFAGALQRNLTVIGRLIGEAQAAGRMKPLPLLQVVGMLMGTVAAPTLIVGTIAGQPWAPPAFAAADTELLTDEAIATRIELALGALATSARREDA